jgi:7-carboxy-7-deazaguanine synthase
LKKTILVSEIFGPTIQGEGSLIGRPTIFVRVGGCDYRCEWCDTLYAVLPKYKIEWAPMEPEEIMDRVEKKSLGHPILITISGGNPALYDGLAEFTSIAQRKRYEVALETQGSKAKGWFASLNHLILSPKPPSSGMVTDWDALDRSVNLGIDPVFKVVVFTEEDFEYAIKVADRYGPVYLQVGNNAVNDPDVAGPYRQDTFDEDEQRTLLLSKLRQMAKEVVDRRRYDLIVLPQLHVLLWGNKRGR